MLLPLGLPLGVEGADHVLRVQHEAESARQLRLDVLLDSAPSGTQPEPAVEGECPWDVGDDHAESVEACGHAASACVRSPSSGDRSHRRRHERDVLVELDELLGALVDVVAIHAGGEGGLLQLLPHGLRLQGFDPSVERVRTHG